MMGNWTDMWAAFDKLFDEQDTFKASRRIERIVNPAASHGCVCPVGAEATCKGPLCPRRPIGDAA
jgi:hypothetical protein